MRYTMTIAAALVLAAAYATPAAAQTDVNPPIFAAAAAPLPAALTPEPVAAADDATAPISVRRVLISTGIGTLAGAGAGLVIGAITTDGCQDSEDWCILSWEEEVALHGFVGAMVGAGVGAIYGLVTSPRRTDTRPAPVTVAPSSNGAVTVGVTLRH